MSQQIRRGFSARSVPESTPSLTPTPGPKLLIATSAHFARRCTTSRPSALARSRLVGRLLRGGVVVVGVLCCGCVGGAARAPRSPPPPGGGAGGRPASRFVAAFGRF